MSFRNTFITDFIYQATDDTQGSNPSMKGVFERYARHLSHSVDERGYGYYAGTFTTLDGSLHDMGLPEIIDELRKVTKMPFRLSILVESGPQVTYEITSYDKSR